MDFLGKWTVLFVGIVFHLLFTMSIFDIYFVSPLVHGMRHYSTPEDAPAQRLFLVVGDGLRADKCFDNITHPITGKSEYLAPFIRSKVLNDATFGISHTRVPTESRPGHVAMIAGFYEDVSAVTKGWKENPVDFDSVLNQTRHTYSYGSPDILPMFAQGASDEGRIETHMYGHDFEDFQKSSIELDRFVFDRVHALFDKAEIDPEVNAALKQDKIVFFLHLLGIDTAGHGYRPYSGEYYNNIKYIDTEIEKLVERVENFYNDDKTSWVFTADHGMSDFGSHGDGDPDNTRTPLVCWGAGVPKPNKQAKGDHNEYSEPWDLNSVKRNDVNQADIASLMSYLVGINYAANSVGQLPLDYLDASPKVKAEALSANAYAISEQYIVKENEQMQRQFNFVPFSQLSGSHNVDARKRVIDSLIESGEYDEAIDKSDELMTLCLAGLRYLQTYNWLFLKTLVTFGFLGWIGYAITSYLHLFIVENPEAVRSKWLIRSAAVAVFASISSLFAYQHSPINFYAYAFFPVFFWYQVFEHWDTLRQGFKLLIERVPSQNKYKTAFATLIFGIVLLESMVAGYFHREIFSIVFGVATMWPWMQNARVAWANLTLSAAWAVTCLTMSVFTMLPVVKDESLVQILTGAGLMAAIGLYFAYYLGRAVPLSTISLLISGTQLGLIVLATLVTNSSIESLQARQGLPLGNQITGWVVMGSSLVVPFFHALSPVSDYRFRLLTIFMAFCPTFIILTISNEGLFYISFFVLLILWIEIEDLMYSSTNKSKAENKRTLSLGEFRISLFFFYLVQVGFFGIGNIASVSSFYLEPVYRLMTVFDPFPMTALLILKILLPFAVLSGCLGILNLRLGVPPSALFSMVLAVSDILSLNFFYLVVDEGSWLDIGTGISHFSISSGLCVFMILLEYLSGVLTSGVTLQKEKTKTK